MEPTPPNDTMPIPSSEKEFAKNDDSPEINPADQQKRQIIKMSIIAVVAILIITIIPVTIVLLAKNNKPQAQTSSIITPKAKVDANATSSLGPERVFVRNNANFSVPYNLSITTPVAWGSAFTDNPDKAYPWENSTLIQAITSKFSPLSDSNTNIVSGNYIAMMDITEWLKTNPNLIAMTPAQKQKWFNDLVSITPENIGALSGAIPNPRLDSEAGGRQHLTPISVSENRFRGMSYITNRIATAYTPEIITMLAGTYEGKQIIIFSQHNVRDTAWATINDLQERSDRRTTEQINATTADFQKGLLGASTIAIHDEYIKAIKTISLKLAE